MSGASNNERLVRMANQIAAFFRTYPDREAVNGVRKHIASFWTPKMRRSLTAYLPEAGDKVDWIVVKALTQPIIPVGEEAPQRSNHLDDELACDAG